MPIKGPRIPLMLKIAPAILVLLGGYYYFFMPAKVVEQSSLRVLERLQHTVNDGPNIRTMLSISQYIDDAARMSLTVRYAGQPSSALQQYELSKQQFLGYINKLFNVTKNPSMRYLVSDVNYNDTSKTQVAQLNVRMEADEPGEWGKIAGHYTVDGLCGTNISNPTDHNTISLLQGEEENSKLGSFNCSLMVDYKPSAPVKP